MSRLRILALFMALSLPFTPVCKAADGVEARSADLSYKALQKETLGKLKANKTFLKAASQIVEGGKNQRAKSFLSMAQKSSDEGETHFREGEYKLAIEDLAESTQMAINAIILVKNEQDESLRTHMIEEELLLREKRDAHRKEALAEKGMNEVAAFIKTAERLLAQNANGAALANITQARALYESAKDSIVKSDYDKALEEIRAAYKLSTGTIKEVKKAEGEIITFPKPAVFNDEKEHYAYELKKNNAYSFFAGQVVKKDHNDAFDMMKSGEKQKNEAAKAMDAGDVKTAVEKIKSSTELYIKAVKGALKK